MRTGIDRDQVKSLLAVDRVPRSTEEPVGVEGDDTIGVLGELLVDPLAEAEYERVVAAIERALGKLHAAAAAGGSRQRT